jgi:hypothetical protein
MRATGNTFVFHLFCWMVSASQMLLIISCQRNVDKIEEPEPILLAEVFHYKLHFDDIKELLQDYETPEDSIQQVRSITEHWVRDRLLLVEAEKNFPKEANMDKLLEDYRQSLLRHFFERRVIEERLDTVITEVDLIQYYEENKQQHRLETGIFRGYYFKIKRPQSRSDRILQWWKLFPSKYYTEVLDYAAANAKTNWTDTTQWHELNMLIQLFPEGTLSEAAVRSKRSITREDRDFIYLCFPLEVYQKNEIAPLSRIREQAARFIIHQRELELLDRIKKEIYDRDIQNERVNIYTN